MDKMRCGSIGDGGAGGRGLGQQAKGAAEEDVAIIFYASDAYVLLYFKLSAVT